MPHRAEIAHHSKGRLRIRVQSAKGDPAALEQIRNALSPVHGVREVTVNEAIGTITVHYDPEHHTDFCGHLRDSEGSHHEHLYVPAPPPPASEVDEAMEMLNKEAEFLSSHSHAAKALFDAIKKCDEGLKRATDNNIDLKVLAPLALAAYTFLELGFEAATPVWLTLGLFSFNHFVTLHSQTPATHPAPGRARPPRPTNPS